jgi:hypothetical protein
MTNDEIQLWMLMAFIFALAISSYKVYMIFTKPVAGLDIKTQHLQLQNIIINFLKDLDNSDVNTQELFALLLDLDILHDEAYKNFNLNRLNQLLQQLYYAYEVSSLSELIESIQHDA